MNPYDLVIEGNLENTLGKDCEDIYIEIFTPESPVKARYIQFFIITYHTTAKSGGLQYLGLMGEKILGTATTLIMHPIYRVFQQMCPTETRVKLFNLLHNFFQVFHQRLAIDPHFRMSN